MKEFRYYVVFELDKSLPQGADFIAVAFFNREEDAKQLQEELGAGDHWVIRVTQRALIRHLTGDQFWPLIQEHNKKTLFPKPSVGRIVVYVTSDAEGEINGTREHPAVIVRAWNDTDVNLKVLTDGPEDLWRTSVSHDPFGAPGTWHWPERT